MREVFEAWDNNRTLHLAYRYSMSDKKVRVAINGFGRIGRAFYKLARQRPEFLQNRLHGADVPACQQHHITALSHQARLRQRLRLHGRAALL